jgi:hypothetical protein
VDEKGFEFSTPALRIIKCHFFKDIALVLVFRSALRINLFKDITMIVSVTLNYRDHIIVN